MMKNSDMGAIADKIFKESCNVVGDLVPGEPITRTIPCPEKTKNKVKIPPRFKGSEYDSSIERDYYKNKFHGKKQNCEEDEETINSDEEIKEIILNQFDGLTPQTTGLSLSDLLGFFEVSDNAYSKNQIVRILQDLINKNIIKVDSITKKMYKNDRDEDEEDEFISPDELIDEDLTDVIIDYFNQSTTGSVSGIKLSKVLKDIAEQTGKKKPEIMTAIKELFQNDTLKKGVNDGTIIINSTINVDTEEEEEGPIPLMNKETPETLKAKGWNEISPGVFLGPDGVQKYALTGESTNLLLNKTMRKFDSDSFTKLCEEFEEDIDNLDIDDTTEGLDEFDDEDIDVEEDTDEDSVQISIPRRLVDALHEIVSFLDGTETNDDELVDDLATDEEANIDLMSGNESDDVSITDTKEDFNYDEDEEDLAGTSTSVFDATFGPSEGGASVKRGTPSYNRTGKPIEGGYRRTAGAAAYDGSGRDGGASMKRASLAYDKSGKPIDSKVTRKARSKNSIFDL